jgi:outer membrane protease
MLLMPDTDPSWTTLSSTSSLNEQHNNNNSNNSQQQQDLSKHSNSIHGETSVNSIRTACLQNVKKIFL